MSGHNHYIYVVLDISWFYSSQTSVPEILSSKKSKWLREMSEVEDR